MPLLGSSRHHAFKPSVYQPGKRSRRLPRWLVLLLVGVAVGAGGVLFLQTNYGPPRLTVEQSEQLHSELNAANLDRQRLQSQLQSAVEQRTQAQKTSTEAQQDTGTLQSRITSLTQDLQVFRDAIPPDPRGGLIGIRSGHITQNATALTYDVLVMPNSDGPSPQPIKASVELTVIGVDAHGRSNKIVVPLINATVTDYQNVTGNTTLPDGFTARAMQVRVLDATQKVLAMRIFYVRRPGSAMPASSRSARVPTSSVTPAAPAVAPVSGMAD